MSALQVLGRLVPGGCGVESLAGLQNETNPSDRFGSGKNSGTGMLDNFEARRGPPGPASHPEALPPLPSPLFKDQRMSPSPTATTGILRI